MMNNVPTKHVYSTFLVLNREWDLGKRDVYEPDAAKEQMKYLIRVY